MADIVITIPQPDPAAPADQAGVRRVVVLTVEADGTMRVEARYNGQDGILLEKTATLVDDDLGAAGSAARVEIKAIVNRVFKTTKILQQMKFQP